MLETIINLIEKYGYLGIAFLILIENIFPPIPSEGILLFGGYFAHQNYLNIWGVIISATIGSILGAVILYLCGYVLGKERLKKLVSGRFFRAIHLGPDEIEKADTWFCRFEKKAVLICRCIPVLRSIVSIPAGISRMKFSSFIALTSIGSLIWNIVISWMGYFAGDAWKKVSDMLGIYSDIVLIICVILALIVFILLNFKFNKNKSDK